MSIPSDNIVVVKLFEKLSNYKDLGIKIEKLWDLKAKAIPEVVGALGPIRNGTIDFIEKVPRSPSYVQKIVLHMLRGEELFLYEVFTCEIFVLPVLFFFLFFLFFPVN